MDVRELIKILKAFKPNTPVKMETLDDNGDWINADFSVLFDEKSDQTERAIVFSPEVEEANL